ncbi:MAG: A/G-specific adenine glycosylase, partial [Bacteroidota bacterium]
MKLQNAPFFAFELKNWYQKNKRDLPWRQTDNPYFIWLSEIILQQTRVAQGLPYYLKFVEAFPTINHFAEATEDEVLRLWQGLGYYSRARNMHSTAKLIHGQFNGLFPNNYKNLLQLKGVGPYTAAAIASFAFEEPVAVLDGNVFRVLSRFFGIETDISSPKGKKGFSEIANLILPNSDSSTHNQAIMEFGALQCTPAPSCESCPVQLHCFAFQQKITHKFPVNLKKLKITNQYLYYFIIEKEGTFYLKKREEKGIWQGLFDFYLVEKENEIDLEDLWKTEPIAEIINHSSILSVSSEYRHQLTHKRLSIWFIHLRL